ncbi:TlpA disulfide reductase family protein [Sphingobacterium sp.]|uniref:TlpA disulfide reductase family protein n=1 Tax=Sphingobacterium sp. TaxID=341027 RepID=UPI002FDD144B
MKKIVTSIFLALSCLGTVLAQGHRFQLIIKGKQFPAKSKIFVRYIVDRKLTIDSINLVSNEVIYKGEIIEPTQVMLFYSQDGASFFNRKGKPMERLTFYVDPLEAKTQIDIKSPFESSQVHGSKLQIAYKQYQDYLKAYEEQLIAQQSKRADLYQAKSRDESALNQIALEIEKIEAQRKNAQRNFITDNPANYFSLLALQEVAGYDDDVHATESLFVKLSPRLKETAIGRKLEADIELAKKLGIGQPALDFAQMTPEGKELKLSDFKGKYLLLDFWASWCGPCRAENPNLVKAYQKFKGAKFEILGVSLDKPGKKDNWMKAIEQDGLTWPQVSDLNGWQNQAAQLYGIQAIPQNYLISPEGKIVGINLKGIKLMQKLEELLK